MIKHLILFNILFFSVQSFSQTQNYWKRKGDFTGLKRERAVGFSINGKGYLGTGVDTTDVARNDWWEYDPVLDTWTQKADVTTARRNAIAFAIGDKGYLGTGMDNADANLGSTLADFWEYDPVLNTWLAKANFPGSGGGGIYFATGFAADNKGYICAGKRGPNNYTAEFWEYKPLTDAWTQRQDFPGGVRYQLASFTVENMGYVGLGIDQDVFRKDIYQYNPATNQWTPKADFPGGERGAVSTFTLGQRGFIVLGSDGGFKKDLWEYNPFEDSWSVRANFGGSNRKNAVAFTIGDSAFVGTGKGLNGKKMSMYVYTPYAVLSTAENEFNNQVKVFPNPIIDNYTVKINSKNADKILIYNVNGKLLQSQTITSNQIEMSRRDLPIGIYFLVIQNENNQVIHSQKLIFK